jgi:hypothetical protein
MRDVSTLRADELLDWIGDDALGWLPRIAVDLNVGADLLGRIKDYNRHLDDVYDSCVAYSRYAGVYGSRSRLLELLALVDDEPESGELQQFGEACRSIREWVDNTVVPSQEGHAASGGSGGSGGEGSSAGWADDERSDWSDESSFSGDSSAEEDEPEERVPAVGIRFHAPVGSIQRRGIRIDEAAERFAAFGLGALYAQVADALQDASAAADPDFRYEHNGDGYYLAVSYVPDFLQTDIGVTIEDGYLDKQNLGILDGLKHGGDTCHFVQHNDFIVLTTTDGPLFGDYPEVLRGLIGLCFKRHRDLMNPFDVPDDHAAGTIERVYRRGPGRDYFLLTSPPGGDNAQLAWVSQLIGKKYPRRSVHTAG